MVIYIYLFADNTKSLMLEVVLIKKRQVEMK